MPEINAYESSDETATRVGIDPASSTITEDQMTTYLAAREAVNDARRELEAAALAPAPPPPSADDLLGQVRQRAVALRAERELRDDLAEVLLAENAEGLTEDEIAGMTISELRQAAGIDATPDQVEDALANDLQANIAAADAEPDGFGSVKWKASLQADLDARDTKPYSEDD